MRKIFIDIGAWTGISAEFFLKNHPQGQYFEIYSFECDHRNIEMIKKRKLPITLIKKAAWIKNGMVKFYYANAGTKAGGTLCPAKTTGHINNKNFYPVSCIDIADFIRTFTDDDYIIMKLNCEGSEYNIIPRLMEERLLSWIDKWYVQWHWDKIGLDKELHDRIADLIDWHPWNAQFNSEKFKAEFIKSCDIF